MKYLTLTLALFLQYSSARHHHHESKFLSTGSEIWKEIEAGAASADTE
jgi:hypothetical protein